MEDLAARALICSRELGAGHSFLRGTKIHLRSLYQLVKIRQVRVVPISNPPPCPRAKVANLHMNQQWRNSLFLTETRLFTSGCAPCRFLHVSKWESLSIVASAWTSVFNFPIIAHHRSQPPAPGNSCPSPATELYGITQNTEGYLILSPAFSSTAFSTTPSAKTYNSFYLALINLNAFENLFGTRVTFESCDVLTLMFDSSVTYTLKRKEEKETPKKDENCEQHN